jgi:ABC-2 type transport system permease protein
MRSLLSVAWARTIVEFHTFVRERMAMAFTFCFPIVLLVVYGSIFRGQRLGDGVEYDQYLVAGMIGAGLFGTSFQNLAIAIPLERDTGGLKRLAATPMPKSAYFLGKIAVTGFVTAVQNLLLLALGVAFFHLHLPDSPGRWLTYLWVGVLGTTACTLLGIGVSGLIRNGRAAPAIISPLAIVVQFVSGVFFVFNAMPAWMRYTGAVLPLKWITQGLRSAFLPAGYAAHEPAGTWEHGRIAVFLALWCLAGLFVAVRTFRWHGRMVG